MSDQIATGAIELFMWTLGALILPLGAGFRCKIGARLVQD